MSIAPATTFSGACDGLLRDGVIEGVRNRRVAAWEDRSGRKAWMEVSGARRWLLRTSSQSGEVILHMEAVGNDGGGISKKAARWSLCVLKAELCLYEGGSRC